MFRSTTVAGVPKLYLNEPANDLWIREIVFPERRNGYFVEAGAADGVSDSSCYFLEKYLGWSGICIEPNDYFFAQLTVNRPKSIHENVCLANHDGSVEFAMASEDDGVSPFRSGIRESLADCKADGAFVLSAVPLVRKQSATLGDILRKHRAPNVIEYGAFDIEGSEFEALRSFPFDEFRFLALTFEVDAAIREPLFALLERNAYRQVTNPFNKKCPWEACWLHESLQYPTA